MYIYMYKCLYIYIYIYIYIRGKTFHPHPCFHGFCKTSYALSIAASCFTKLSFSDLGKSKGGICLPLGLVPRQDWLA